MNYLHSLSSSVGGTQLFLKLEEKLSLTVQQQAVAKIAAVILGLSVLLYLLYKEGQLRRMVTVEDSTGKTEKMSIEKVNGKAKVTWSAFLASGAVIEGEFTNGELNGDGTILYPIGSIAKEEGKYKGGYLDGQGKVTYRDGKVVEGDFKMGQLVTKEK